MRFQVTRASSWKPEDKPYDKCIPIKVMQVETRRCRTAEEFNNCYGLREGEWYSVGSNHRLSPEGYITRDIKEVDRWGIEINSFEELIAFKEEIKHDLVLTTSYEDYSTPMIIIYDDYIE